MEIFYFARCTRKLCYYGEVIHSFEWKSAVDTMVVFKMRDSVPSVNIPPVCNVLRPWRIRLIPTYRVGMTL